MKFLKKKFNYMLCLALLLPISSGMLSCQKEEVLNQPAENHEFTDVYSLTATRATEEDYEAELNYLNANLQVEQSGTDWLNGNEDRGGHIIERHWYKNGDELADRAYEDLGELRTTFGPGYITFEALGQMLAWWAGHLINTYNLSYTLNNGQKRSFDFDPRQYNGIGWGISGSGPNPQYWWGLKGVRIVIEKSHAGIMRVLTAYPIDR